MYFSIPHCSLFRHNITASPDFILFAVDLRLQLVKCKVYWIWENHCVIKSLQNSFEWDLNQVLDYFEMRISGLPPILKLALKQLISEKAIFLCCRCWSSSTLFHKKKFGVILSIWVKLNLSSLRFKFWQWFF
jgi:hypothetical protein